MFKIKHKLVSLIGILLILAGGFGWGYTYMMDHRSASNLSAYCDIDFKSGVDLKGQISTVNLTILDYRYGSEQLVPRLQLICDDQTFDIEGVSKQLPPSYSLAFYNDKTTFKNSNKLFAEFPAETFEAIRKANTLRIKFSYTNGDVIDLPLNTQDTIYWKNQ